MQYLSTKPAPGTKINWSHTLSRNMVGCWLYNEGSGLRAYDITGYKSDGLLTNFNNLIHERSSLGLVGNGTSNKVTCGLNTKINMSTYNWSICVYVKLSTDTDSDFIWKGASTLASVGYWFWYYSTDKDLRCYITDGTTRLFSNSRNLINLADGKFHTCCVSNSRSSKASFYLDGIFINSSVGEDSIISSLDGIDITDTTTRQLQMLSGGTGIYGVLNAAYIWKRTLSSSEARELHINPYCMMIT